MTKPTKTHFNPLLLFLILIAALIFTGYILFVSPRAIAETEKPFDHSNCQYPFRASNPPNGCDNSDPAVPECVSPKVIDEQACIADYASRNAPQGNSTPLQPETLMSQNTLTGKEAPLCAQ